MIQRLEALNTTGLDYDALITTLKTTCQCKGKALFQPLRLLLTGQLQGPELKALMPLIGLQRLLQRVKRARDFIDHSDN